MNKFTRILRHLRSTSGNARRLFPAATLQAIQNAIAAGEQHHRAEVRVIVEAALPWSSLWAAQSARARAHDLFARDHIWDTEENCGVLLYINLADHKVEIVADRSVGRTLSREDWHAICRRMTAGFAEGNYHDGAMAALQQLNDLLTQHFPLKGMQHNEISNRPIVL